MFLPLLVAFSSPARGEDLSRLSDEERTQRARELFERGREHVNLHEYQAASQEFEQAYVLKPLPLFLFNLAELAYCQNQRARALRYYEAYAHDSPGTPEAAKAEQRIAELKLSLADNPEPPPAAPAREPPSPPGATSTTTPQHAATPASVLVAPSQPAPAPVSVSKPIALAAAPSPPPSHRKRWVALGVTGGALAVAAVVLAVVLTIPRSPPSGTLGAPIGLMPR